MSEEAIRETLLSEEAVNAIALILERHHHDHKAGSLLAHDRALRSELGEAQRERDEARAELARLQERLENPELVVDEMHYSSRDDKPVSINCHEAGDPFATRIMAASFARTFRDSGAENYVESRWHWTNPDDDTDHLDLLVRIQRMFKPTPHELREVAERALGEAQDTIRRYREGLQALVDAHDRKPVRAETSWWTAARALLSEGETP